MKSHITNFIVLQFCILCFIGINENIRNNINLAVWGEVIHADFFEITNSTLKYQYSLVNDSYEVTYSLENKAEYFIENLRQKEYLDLIRYKDNVVLEETFASKVIYFLIALYLATSISILYHIVESYKNEKNDRL